MTVELTPGHEQFIQDAIRSGQFRSVEDAVNRAFSVLRQSTFSAAPRLARVDLATFLLNSPLANAELDLERRKDYPHPIKL
jgi:Arc/MetJ-type ribon-helix-helix transcriptional regulator